jgi:hypothetical protein
MSQGLSVSVAAFPFQTRWLHAGGDLSRPNHIHQCTDRALMRSEHQPKCLLHSADLPGDRHGGGVVLASDHHRGSVQTSNPHSTRC